MHFFLIATKSLTIQQNVLKISRLFPSSNLVNFDRQTIFVGTVVPQICRQEAKKKKKDSTFFSLSELFYLHRSIQPWPY